MIVLTRLPVPLLLAFVLGVYLLGVLLRRMSHICSGRICLGIHEAIDGLGISDDSLDVGDVYLAYGVEEFIVA